MATGVRPAQGGVPVLAWRVKALIVFTCLVAAALSGPITLGGTTADWPLLLSLGIAACVAERFDINLYGDSHISISGLFLLTLAIAVGPFAVVVVAPAAALSGHLGRGRPSYKLLFNASVFLLTSLASAYVYLGVGQLPASDLRAVQAGAAVLAGLADYLVSSCLVTLAITTTTGEAPTRVFREKFAWLWPHFAVAGLLAFVLALTAHTSLGVWGLLGFTVPVLATRFSMKQYVEKTERMVTDLRLEQAHVESLSRDLQDAYDDTLVAVAAALDIRDVETHGHSLRVSALSVEIGERLGIAQGTQEWVDLKNGSLLHDVGKIGVPDAILRKPGPLDEQEWVQIRLHPRHGFEMLEPVRFLRGAAHLVLHHHESFDGSGYPHGLRGEEIPLAARIFAVADTFDAITSVRPYKAALSAESALAEIVRCSGSQFDPQVVRVLLEIKGAKRLAA